MNAKDASTDTLDLVVKMDVWTQTNIDCDATRLNSPCHDQSEHHDQADDDYDSDATRLNSPSHDQSDHDVESDTTSEGSYIETYTCDPNYPGPAYPSQPCSRHGVSYTPPGWKRIMVKRRKLEFHDSSNEKDAEGLNNY